MVEGLPDDALWWTTPEAREERRAEGEWDTHTELLAQILEEVTILSSDHRRKKPVEVPRPSYLTAPDAPGGADESASYASAIDRMMAAPVPA